MSPTSNTPTRPIAGTPLRYCPITGERLPVTDPGRTLSDTAVNQFRTKTRGLADTMSIIDQLVAGARHSEKVVTTQAGSRPPLNLAILAAIDDDRDTIDVWANNLAQHANPNIRYRPGNWIAIEQVFTHYADQLSHWHHGTSLPGVLCVHRVTAALDHLTSIADPAKEMNSLTELQRLNARDRLENTLLTIGPACEAVRLITGKRLPRETVYTWERRGKLEGKGEPKRFLVRELLTLQ